MPRVPNNSSWNYRDEGGLHRTMEELPEDPGRGSPGPLDPNSPSEKKKEANTLQGEGGGKKKKAMLCN